MREFHIESLHDAIDFMNFDCKAFFDRAIFRGQSNILWELKASAFRTGIRIPFSVTDDFVQWCRKNGLLRRFNDDVLLQVAQHYGLPTDLLDFTKNPLVACFFALKPNDSFRNEDKAAVYVVDAQMLDNIESLAFNHDIGNASAVIKKYRGMYREGYAMGLSRLHAQEGVFVRDAHGTLDAILSAEHEILGLSYEKRFGRPLTYWKIIIDSSKANAESLSSMGVSKGGLFPPPNVLEQEFVSFINSYEKQDEIQSLRDMI